MGARSVVTVGVSTERGAVHAVVLADTGEHLPERILLHRVERTRGDTKADVAAAVETAMDEVASEIGPHRRIAGAAVAYRDAAERRAIVTRLASGPWHSTSMVSTKSAHLSLAAMMPWLADHDHLLICEVVPGYQSFTLVDRARTRVLAATSQSGIASEHSLAIAVTAAWDQLEAAAVRPDAVVMIGSAADAAVVRAALEGFGVPVLPCPISVSAPAAGAAISALPETVGVVSGDDVEDVPRYGRGTAALLAAASVLAGGLLAGGVYMVDSLSTPTSTVLADTHTTADSRVIEEDAVSPPPAPAPVIPGRTPTITLPRTQGPTVPAAHDTGTTGRFWGTRPMTLDQPTPALESEERTPEPLTPGTGAPGSTRVGNPDAAMLFPGETPPPPAFTPEAQQWWDNHFRLMMQWASEQLTPAQPEAPEARTERSSRTEESGEQRSGAHDGGEYVEGGAIGQRTAVHGRHAAGRHAAV
ncbi:hypothetical protein ACWEKT_38555 [Nocardia takedensis]